MGAKSATKKKLIDLGIPSPHARALAFDRTLEQVKDLKVDQIGQILGVSTEVADEILSLIHEKQHSISLRTKFSHALTRLSLAVDDLVLNGTEDTRRIDATPLIYQHSASAIPSFTGSYESTDEALLDALNLIAVEWGLGPGVAASLLFHIENGTTLVITGTDFHQTSLATAAQEMADAEYLTSDDAQILSDHSYMLPGKARPIQVGDKVGCACIGSEPKKSYSYRPRSCSGRSSNPVDDYRWPSSRKEQIGTVTYSWRFDNLFDVTFSCGTRFKIHVKHMVKVLSSDRSDVGWPY